VKKEIALGEAAFFEVFVCEWTGVQAAISLLGRVVQVARLIFRIDIERKHPHIRFDNMMIRQECRELRLVERLLSVALTRAKPKVVAPHLREVFRPLFVQ